MSEIDYISNTILYTDRLCLRPLRDEDAPQIFALRSDATVNQYLDRTPCKTLEDAKVFISGIIERTKDSSLYYWAVCMQDECIGAVCLFDFSEEEQSIEIGFELLPKFHGNGYMQEATAKVIYFIFEKLMLKKIHALVHPDNINSIKLLQKLNFIKIDHLEENPKSNLIRYLLKI
ncbi:MAG: GNAT family N-acetyltransferase [Saprospiraceae bacterium]|nr:GNAT family N-acetyltransferase [Saprospiraceae bacterium]MBK7811612.1 GNAT family N-acetyltransferase [Saprospiraceae bacterium]